MKCSGRLFFLVNFLIAIALIIYFIIIIPCLIFYHTYLPNNSGPHYISDDPSDVGEKQSKGDDLFIWVFGSLPFLCAFKELFSLLRAKTMFHFFYEEFFIEI